MDHKKLLRAVGPAIGGVLLCVAAFVLWRVLSHYELSDVTDYLAALPVERTALAIVLAASSYLMLGLYDVLGLRFLGRPMPYPKVGLTAFIATSYSNTLGHSMLSGGSVRYRLYSAAGVRAGEIARLIVFWDFAVWLGYFLLGGVVLLFVGVTLPPSLHLHLVSSRPIGALLALVAATFFLWSALRQRPLRFRGKEIELPGPRLSLLVGLISCADWAAVAGIVYSLLPPTRGLSFLAFLGVFLLAQTIGMLSQVPGGLGVFETIMVILLGPLIAPPQLMGALLVYRAIYYLAPFLLASLLLGFGEAMRNSPWLRRNVARLRRVLPAVVPDAMALLTFGAGALLLFSGATPAMDERMRLLRQFLPVPVIVFSHLVGSIVGLALLLLARGLQRRLDGAWLLSVASLCAGIVASLAKGFDYEEALLLSAALLALLASRRHFFRRTSLMNESFSRGWVAAIALVLLCSLWLVMFSFQHAEYSHESWWSLPLRGYGPRAERATVFAVAVALLVGIARLLRPATPVEVERGPELERALPIVRRSRTTLSSLALLGDKELLFSDSGQSFIMYAVEGKSWVALGDPVGPDEERAPLARKFREMCDRHSGWCVFYQVAPEHLPLYLDLNLSLQKLGLQARVRLEDWSLDGKERKKFRHLVNRLNREGCSFEIMGPEHWPALQPELQAISEAWLAEKATREKGFSLGFFNPDYLRHFPLALVRQGGRIVAFANLLESADQEELSVDLMRFLPGGPEQTMEYLLVHLLQHGREQGWHWFDLGMAPLSGLETGAYATLWQRLGALLFLYGEKVYNFQGVRSFKEKFDPVWEPRYLASSGGVALPRILANLSVLISGGLRGVIAK